MTIRNALLLAGAILALSLTLSWASGAGHVSDDTARRAMQVACGLVVVYFANLVPKTLEPLSAKCEPGRVQALQRFSGWTLVIAGLGYSLAWLVAPLEHARLVSIAILATGVLLVVARCLWTLGTRERGQPSA